MLGIAIVGENLISYINIWLGIRNQMDNAMHKDWYTFVDALIDRLREAHIIVTV